MIKQTITIQTVIRTPEDMVFVFSEDDRQVPKYQGMYREVRELILRNTGADTIFKHWPTISVEPGIVARNNW